MLVFNIYVANKSTHPSKQPFFAHFKNLPSLSPSTRLGLKQQRSPVTTILTQVKSTIQGSSLSNTCLQGRCLIPGRFSRFTMSTASFQSGRYLLANAQITQILNSYERAACGPQFSVPHLEISDRIEIDMQESPLNVACDVIRLHCTSHQVDGYHDQYDSNGDCRGSCKAILVQWYSLLESFNRGHMQQTGEWLSTSPLYNGVKRTLALLAIEIRRLFPGLEFANEPLPCAFAEGAIRSGRSLADYRALFGNRAAGNLL